MKKWAVSPCICATDLFTPQKNFRNYLVPEAFFVQLFYLIDHNGSAIDRYGDLFIFIDGQTIFIVG